MVVIGVEWSDEGPRARVAQDERGESLTVPLIGLGLNYRVSPSSPRRCLGRRSVSESGWAHVDCTSAPEPGQRHCRRCSAAEALVASNMHQAHKLGPDGVEERFRAHLAKPNVLYLAAFRDGSVKVGTSRADRITRRLAEQAAWMARLVARSSDGFAVREAEDHVTAELGIPQSISVRRKLEGMVRPRGDDRLGSELDAGVAPVHAQLVRLDDPRLVPQVESWRHPRADAPAWAGVHPYPLSLATGQHDLEVVDACGRLVALRRPGRADTFVADLGALFGLVLETGSFVSDELAVQDSLF
jgi:hypothetical protein